MTFSDQTPKGQASESARFFEQVPNLKSCVLRNFQTKKASLPRGIIFSSTDVVVEDDLENNQVSPDKLASQRSF